ncbi:sulfite exporter TauE/SafE family protein [Rhodobacteraceae bacterium NNCM2]|nr:sulfite exporter TauE/SafE family protein [Coraliihabitans acroporae]
MPEPITIAVVVATFLLGGFVKGAIGLGLPVVVLVVLSQIMPVRDAVSIFLLPGIFSNVWQATNGPYLGALLRRLWPFLLAAIVGIVIGVSVLASTKTGSTVALLGFLLICYSLYSLFAPRLPEPGKNESWMAPLAASSGGVLFGMTGIFIVPGILYLEMLRMPRDQFVQALGLTFVVISSTLALSLTGHSLLTVEHMVLSAMALGPVFLGLWLGRKLRHHFSESGFRKVFFIALIFVGAHMIWRSMGA